MVLKLLPVVAPGVMVSWLVFEAALMQALVAGSLVSLHCTGSVMLQFWPKGMPMPEISKAVPLTVTASGVELVPLVQVEAGVPANARFAGRLALTVPPLMAVPATRDLLVMVSTMVFGVAGGLSVRFWLAGVAAMDAMPPQEPPPKAASIKACPTLRVPCVADV